MFGSGHELGEVLSVEWVSLPGSRSVRVCVCWDGESVTVPSSAGLPSLASEAPLADAASVASECCWHSSTQIWLGSG
eukprot:m.435778 g.435778  ORF g.435778 m.435778 type:complete len:77 (+) comp103552_c0_seq1:395-625(+)